MAEYKFKKFKQAPKLDLAEKRAAMHAARHSSTGKVGKEQRGYIARLEKDFLKAVNKAKGRKSSEVI